MLKITRDSHSAQQLYQLARRTRDWQHARRLRGLAVVLEGHSRGVAAKAQGVTRQTLADWVRLYNHGGPQGLRPRPRGGGACRLTESQQQLLRGWLEDGPDWERDGLVHWRLVDLRQRIELEFGVRYSLEGVRRLLQRLGFRHLSARPVHPKADPQKQREFRANFTATVQKEVQREQSDESGGGESDGETGDAGPSSPSEPAPGREERPAEAATAVAGLAGGQPESRRRPQRTRSRRRRSRRKSRRVRVEVWFQDEARIGWKGSLTRIQAGRGTCPRVVRDHRYGYRYWFAAGCASRGKAVGRVTKGANTEYRNQHLADISRAVRSRSIGVVVLDGAGWHRCKALQVPKNLRLVVLPPYSPELNPMEPVFQYWKANRFSNRVFRDVQAVHEACQETWDWFCGLPERIGSILRRSWVTAAEAACNLVPGPSEPSKQCV